MTKHQGAGQSITPEHALEEALSIGLFELANDREALEDVLLRSDALRYSTAPEWRDEMIAAALDMLDPASPNRLWICLSYDEAIARMPAISIEISDDNENEAEATMGDELGAWYSLKGERVIPVLSIDADAYLVEVRAGAAPADRVAVGDQLWIRSADGNTAERVTVLEVDPGAGDNGGDLLTIDGELENTFAPLTERVVAVPQQQDREAISIRHTIIGVGRTSSALIGCYSPAPERALLLRVLVMAALFRQKPALQDKGIQELSTSTGNRRPTPDMEPRLGSIPTVTARLRWTFRTTRSKTVPNRVTIGSGTFST